MRHEPHAPAFFRAFLGVIRCDRFACTGADRAQSQGFNGVIGGQRLVHACGTALGKIVIVVSTTFGIEDAAARVFAETVWIVPDPQRRANGISVVVVGAEATGEDAVGGDRYEPAGDVAQRVAKIFVAPHTRHGERGRAIWTTIDAVQG